MWSAQTERPSSYGRHRRATGRSNSATTHMENGQRHTEDLFVGMDTRLAAVGEAGSSHASSGEGEWGTCKM